MDLSDILTLIVGLVVLHLSNLYWLSAYVRGYSGLLAPRDVLISRSHLLGIAAAACGVLVFVATGLTDTLEYGIFPATGLFVADAFLTYRAVKRQSSNRSGRRNRRQT